MVVNSAILNNSLSSPIISLTQAKNCSNYRQLKVFMWLTERWYPWVASQCTEIRASGTCCDFYFLANLVA